jgi:hypothetical protein
LGKLIFSSFRSTMKSQNVNDHEYDAPDAPLTRTASAEAREATAPASSGKKATTTAAVTTSTSSSILPRMSDPSPISASNSESPQPMEKPASASSHGASKDGAAGTASPYGTRSRNRNGASRPNYAEDKDIDMDLFDSYPDRRDDDSRKTLTRQASLSNAAAAAAASAAQAATPRSANAASRKPLPSSDDAKQHHTTPQHSAAKENHHNGNHRASPTASSTANGVAANGTTKSKKRKADPASTASGSQTPSAHQAGSTGVNKRHKADSHGGNGIGTTNGNSANRSARDGGYGETNMLTFESCGARLKDGKMVADDGTVLEVNGE